MFSTAGTFLFVVCGTNDCWRCVIFVVQNGIMGRLVGQAQRRNFRALVLWNGGLGWADGMESGVKIVQRLIVMDGKAGSPLVWCYQSILITEDRC
jgi:hypothetical protein